MNNLKFKSLRILSDLEKKANQYQFEDRFNLIVGTTNSVGKSHIVKNLFWAFGCEPFLDPDWEALDCKVLVEFSIGDRDFKVARHGERIFLSEGTGEFQLFSKITGEYSKSFSKLVNFNVLLPVRDKEEVVTPPPAYYFLPYYINQSFSWSKAWVSFDKLGQFSGWQKEVVQYHTGITDKDYFELADEVYGKKREFTEIDEQLSRIDTAISVVREYIPDVETAIDLEGYGEIIKELEVEVAELHNEQESLFEKLATLRAEKEHIENQYSIAQRAVVELEKDYDFALENEEEIECPTCGVVHDNTLVSRFSILSDKDQAEQIVNRLNKQRKKIILELEKEIIELEMVRQKIARLNNKYIRENDNETIQLQDILDTVAVGAVQKKVANHRKEKAQDLYDTEKSIENIKKQQKSIADEMRKVVNDDFQSIYPALTNKLHAYNVNATSIKGPLNYGKVAKSGGDAERSRAMLAYYLTIYKLIHLHSEEVLSPLIVDTPRQHEQAAAHYDRIVKTILDDTPPESQIFLCGMDSVQLDQLKTISKVIILTKEKGLLNKEKYEDIKKYMGSIFEKQAV